MGRILAAGDIGSNTAHLLVADVDKGKVRRISDQNEWISLGESVTRTGEVPAETFALLSKTLNAFKRLAHFHNAEGIYVFGTEALRKAKNSKQVIKQLKSETGISVDLIDGHREAGFGLRGAWIDTAEKGKFGLCEVGGGSAQVANCSLSGSKPIIESEASLRLGTGTLIAQFDLTTPVTTARVDAFRKHIEDCVDAIEPKKVTRLITCGGVARGMKKALHPDDDPIIHAEELDYLIWAASRLSPSQIATRFGVKYKRSATLLPGACVFRAVMDRFGMDSMTVSRFGVREGAILEMAEAKIKMCPL